MANNTNHSDYLPLLIIKIVDSFRLARQKCDKNGNGITIAERMDNIADEYEGIWSISEDDIVELEKHIKIISQKEEEFDDLIAKAK